MMKAIAGSMVGGLVAGTIALVASSASQSSSVDAGRMTSPTSAQVQTTAPQNWGLDHVTFTGAPENGPASAPSTLVQCEPHQQALMERRMIDGREVSTVSCVSTTMSMAPAAVSTVAYVTAAPVAAARPAVVRERVVERDVRRAPKRSWGKTALVIGGTSGAGAGIGALIGGKKGALIGAAIGGGSGAIYEVTKRK
jgi:hypothetical protein